MTDRDNLAETIAKLDDITDPSRAAYLLTGIRLAGALDHPDIRAAIERLIDRVGIRQRMGGLGGALLDRAT